MPLKPASRMSLRITLRALFFLLLCSWPLASVRAQDVVRLTLNIKVTDKNGKPVPKATILIPRQGKNTEGQPLKNIEEETNADGELVRTETDFDLTGPAHSITVKSPEFPQPLVKELSADDLRKAYNNNKGKLELPLSPQKEPGNVVILNIMGKVTDTGDRPLPNVQISIPLRNQALQEISAKTDNNGNYSKGAEFHLDGLPHTLTAKASGFEPQSVSLTDDELRGAETVLKIQPIKLGVESPSFLQKLKYVLNNIVWVIGLLTLLGLLGLWPYKVWQKKHRPQTSSVQPDNVSSNVSPVTSYGGSQAAPQGTPKPATAGLSPGPEDDPLERDWKTTVSNVYVIKQKMLTNEAFQKEINELKALVKSLRPRERDNTRDGIQSGATESPAELAARQDASLPTEDIDGESAHIGAADAGAMASYRNLINKIPVTPEPLYLDVEEARSPAGKLEDANIYLAQVTHSQAALVLFAESSNSGWVFPNPKVSLRPAALKDVFPEIKAGEFDAAKDSIRPKQVKKIEEGRWMVEQ